MMGAAYPIGFIRPGVFAQFATVFLMLVDGGAIDTVLDRGQNVLDTAPLQQAMSGNYLGGRAARRFAGTLLRLFVTGFLVLAASNNCRMPCSNSPTAFSKAPSWPTRT